MGGVFFLPLAESPGKSHSRGMLRVHYMRMALVALLSLGLAACGYFEKEKAPAKPMAAPIMVPPPTLPKAEPKPEPEPEVPFNVLGAVLGDACPRDGTLLAAYARCANGRIITLNLTIPAFDADAKARVFARAIAKYGTPDEDRRGGLPMRVKVMMPDWAATKTQPDLRPYHGKRSAFWWIDEMAQHFLSVDEGDEAVRIRVMLVNPKARLDFDKQQAMQEKLQAIGDALTEKF